MTTVSLPVGRTRRARPNPSVEPRPNGGPQVRCFTAARKNPYAAQQKKPVTIRLDQDAVTYFKSLAEETGIPYQSLINLYLRNCAASKKKINLAWT